MCPTKLLFRRTDVVSICGAVGRVVRIDAGVIRQNFFSDCDYEVVCPELCIWINDVKGVEPKD